MASQFDRVVDTLAQKLPAIADHLDQARAELFAFTPFPKEIRRQIWSNNPQERLNKKIRRLNEVVGIFPDRNALIHLVGAVLAEQHDEWTKGRRYLGIDVLDGSQTASEPDAKGRRLDQHASDHHCRLTDEEPPAAVPIHMHHTKRLDSAGLDSLLG